MRTLKPKGPKSPTKKPAPKNGRVVELTPTTPPAAGANESSLTPAISRPLTLATKIYGKWSVSFKGLGTGEWDAYSATTMACVAGIVFAKLTYTGIAVNLLKALKLISVDPVKREATVRLKNGAPTMPLGNRFRCMVTGDFPLEQQSDSYLPS